MGKKGPLWWRESDWLLRGSSAANQILLRHSGPILSIVISDWDLLQSLDQNTFGASTVIERILKWILTNIAHVVEAKKDQLYKIRSGTIVEKEPKFIWVKMIKRL